MLTAAIVLIGAALLLGGIGLAGARRVDPVTRALDALTDSPTRSEEVRREVDRPLVERVVAPFHDRCARLGRRLTGMDKAERLRRSLDVAGNPHDWSVDTILAFKVAGAVALPIAGLGYCALVDASVTVLVAAPLACVAIGFLLPEMYLYNKGHHRSEAIRAALADTVDLLAISVEAGLGFDAALLQVARNTQGPLSEELARVLREMQLGTGRADALRRLAERTDVDELKSFVSAMIQTDAFGISIATVLRTQAAEMRVKRRQYAEARARQVPVKIMMPLVACILPCLLVVVIGPAALDMYRTLNL
ncbi:type II secretion system F family protein [Nocardioides sp. YIM 152588]|uniref:type II secretion system F family protein n=1 Tax=Nocardioides sp. YIM 152588 TaxID=3158259 RepID=UPI0032E40CBD